MRLHIPVVTVAFLFAAAPPAPADFVFYQGVTDTEILHDGICTGPNCGPVVPAFADSSFFVATRPSCDRYKHALLRFDLSSLPASTPIDCVTLRLWAIRESEFATNVFTVARVTEPWTQELTNWCFRDSGVPWCSPGGCFTLDGATSVPIVAGHGTNRYVEWDVTAIVRKWVNEGLPNNGFAIFQEFPSQQIGNQEVLFASTNRTNRARYGPRLTIRTGSLPCWDAGITPPTSDTYINHDTSCTPNPCGLGAPAYPETSLVVSIRPPCGRDGRALVKFDLSSIPSGAPVGCARLRMFALNQNEYVSSTLRVQRLIQSWDEAAVNYCARTGTAMWDTPGGSVSTEGTALAAVPSKHGGSPASGPYNEWIEWDVTEIVQRWITQDSLNAGFMVSQISPPNAAGNQAIRFASAENPRAEYNAPQLFVHLGWSDCSVVSGTPEDPYNPGGLAPHPNPARPGSTIHFPIMTDPGRSTYVARIFDVSGRLVRELHLASGSTRTLEWDGRTADGRTVPRGLYTALIHDGLGRRTARVMLTH